MRALLLAALLALVAPAVARAADGATIVVRELPVGGARTTAGAAAPSVFDLAGFHWQGSGTVLFRTHAVAGQWSSWRPVAPEAEDLPDPGSREARLRRGWRLGSPYWVGASDRVAYRVVGDVRRLRVWYVWSPVERAPLRTTAMAGTPKIVLRRAWGANEEITRGTPRYARADSFAVVHHTAGSNAYTRSQSAAIVRGIELYHVRGNGWNDIGYNFLVDKYGQVFEGRAGGIERNVIGAHAQGFNTGSTGVAVIGNYSSTKISPAALHALVGLLAWRLDVAHVDPSSTLTWRSGGNPEYRLGKAVKLRAISGHRDTGPTSCPGAALYGRLPDIARMVAATGLPKLYAPQAVGGLGGPVRFTATLSAPGAWTVTVKGASGALVARGRGSGTAVAWTWNAARIANGSYTWTIEAGPQTRPASGTIGKAPPLPPPASSPIVVGLAAAPPVVSPDGDGIDDALVVSYTLTARASVTVTVVDATGAVAATPVAAQLQGPRQQSFSYAADGLVDGAYTVVVSAAGEDGRTGRLGAPFAVDRTLSGLALSRSTLSPNGDGLDDTLGIAFTLSSSVNVVVQIEQAGVLVATVVTESLPAGAAQLMWDGTTPSGPAAPGAYDAVVLVDGPFGRTRHAVSFTVSG
jgi:uncharacterized protein with LGFP repeats